MTTTDTVLLYIIAICLTILTLFAIAVVVALLKLVLTMQRVIERSEEVINSVESAITAYRDAQGKKAIFKVIKNIFNMGYKARKRS